MLLQACAPGDVTLADAYPGAVASEALLETTFTPRPFQLVRDKKRFLQGASCAACPSRVIELQIHHPAHPIPHSFSDSLHNNADPIWILC